MKQSVNTLAAPQPVGAYSQAIKSGNVVLLAGQIPLDPQTGELIQGDFRQQVEQIFKNLSAVAEAAGGSINHIARLGVFLTDINQTPIINEVMGTFFNQPFPARTTIQVVALPKCVSVEIDAIMVLSY